MRRVYPSSREIFTGREEFSVVGGKPASRA